MDDEILWKWELLCNEFDDAKKNYITIFTPLLKKMSEKKTGIYANDIVLQIEKAESAWRHWVEIQIKLKTFVEEHT